MPGVPWHTQILADQLTLFQPGGTDYAHLINTGTPRFSDLPTALLKYVIHPAEVQVNSNLYPENFKLLEIILKLAFIQCLD